MTIKNLCVAERYKQGGEDKVKWNRIGVMFESNGKEYIKLYHMPGILISVYEQKKKETESSGEEF